MVERQRHAEVDRRVHDLLAAPVAQHGVHAGAGERQGFAGLAVRAREVFLLEGLGGRQGLGDGLALQQLAFDGMHQGAHRLHGVLLELGARLLVLVDEQQRGPDDPRQQGGQHQPQQVGPQRSADGRHLVTVHIVIQVD